MNLLSLVIAPLQVVVLFFAPHAATFSPVAVAGKPASTRLPSRWLADHSSTALARPASGRVARITYPHAVAQVTAKPIHRVRVVRNVDTALPADRAGRMLVSGRFADVCAELDRLAATNTRAAA